MKQYMPVRLSIVITLFSIIACNSKNKESYQFISDADSYIMNAISTDLKGRTLDLFNNFEGSIINMEIYDDKLFVQDMYSDYLLDVYDINNFTLLSQIGKEGEAPDELKNLEFVKVNTIDSDGIQVFDFITKSIAHYYLDDKKNASKILIPKEYNTTTQAALYVNEKIVLSDLSPKEELLLYNQSTKLAKSIPFSGPFKIAPNVDTSLFKPRNLGYSKSLDFIYTWSTIWNGIKIYSPDLEYLGIMTYGENENTDLDYYYTNRNKIYYYNVKHSENLILGLYLGVTSSEEALKSVFSSLKSELHIFDFDSKVVNRFVLDRLVNVCTIDINRNIVYCIDEGNESKPIVIYEL